MMMEKQYKSYGGGMVGGTIVGNGREQLINHRTRLCVRKIVHVSERVMLMMTDAMLQFILRKSTLP